MENKKKKKENKKIDLSQDGRGWD